MPDLPIQAKELHEPLSQALCRRLAPIMLFPHDSVKRYGLDFYVSHEHGKFEGNASVSSSAFARTFAWDAFDFRRALMGGVLAAKIVDSALYMEQTQPGTANLQRAKRMIMDAGLWRPPLGCGLSEDSVNRVWGWYRSVAHMWCSFIWHLQNSAHLQTDPFESVATPWEFGSLFPCHFSDVALFLARSEAVLS